MNVYYRPIVQTDAARPPNAISVAGAWGWFVQAERISRNSASELVDVADIPQATIEAISAPRAPMAGLHFEAPHLMGILNVTPDSFSDGGHFHAPEAAINHARQMEASGADMIDIGGESTRPGAEAVSVDLEISRTKPVIAAIRSGSAVPISIDTRKAEVAGAALAEGANLVNDVSALTFDRNLANFAAQGSVPVCLMHAQGDPKTMQAAPKYNNVLLDVFDFLSERVDAAVAAGIPRNQIMVDPGIGFGKTVDHNLTLLRGISLFHSLGCVILLGASRKRFIGTVGNVPSAEDRAPGSIAVALAAVLQGVQVIRVHDIKETRQALSLLNAVKNIEQGQK